MLEWLLTILARLAHHPMSVRWGSGGYPVPRLGQTGAAAIKRTARKRRNCRRARHA